MYKTLNHENVDSIIYLTTTKPYTMFIDESYQ